MCNLQNVRLQIANILLSLSQKANNFIASKLISCQAVMQYLRNTLRELLHKINGDFTWFHHFHTVEMNNEDPSSRLPDYVLDFIAKESVRDRERERERCIYKNIYKVTTRVEYGSRMCIYVYTRIFDVCMSSVVMCIDGICFHVRTCMSN